MFIREICNAQSRSLTSAVTEGVGGDPLYQFANLDGVWPGGDLSVRRNVWRHTESLASADYSIGGSATKRTDTISVNGITLTRLSVANFFSSVSSNIAGLSLTPFTAGHRYLVSCFVQGATDQFMWMRFLTNGSSNGHGPKLIHNRPRRIWILMQATGASNLVAVVTPTTTLGGDAADRPYWLFQGNTEGGAGEVYIGGFQIEDVSNSSYVDGVALIGDSTMAGSSGGIDSTSISAREVSTWAAGLLNVPFFNRAIGGNTTTDMDGRWATDISPLKANCKYAVIQGGINDFGNSVALATVQANIASMNSKAIADGLIPVFLTCTPSAGIVDVPADEANRVAFNAWLKATYANVIDIAAVVADPSNPSALLPAYAGDGTHYNSAAKRAVGIAVAAWTGWAFTTPTPYQAVLGTTYP